MTKPVDDGAVNQSADAALDAAAERAHNAMFDCELASSGIERELWRNVARAVLVNDDGTAVSP